jgi:transketolase
VIIIATGSEVGIAVEAFEMLQQENISVRVVSMPSADVFSSQTKEYQESVLPNSCRKRLAVETAHSDYWRKWVGLDGDVIGMESFGESGPGAEVLKHFGFTAANIVKRVKEMR